MSNKPLHNADDSRGSAIVLLLALILALLYFGTLIVDLTQGELVARLLQKSVDAACLGGANQLVHSSGSDIERWENSKRAVIALLRSNLSLYEYDFPDIHDARHHDGSADLCEDAGSAYRFQIYDNGRFRISLERGYFENDAAGTFTSYESSTQCKAELDPPPNAVRLTVIAFRYPTVFGWVVGVGEFTRITRTGLGAEVD